MPRLVYGLFRSGAPADWGATAVAVPAAFGWRNVFTDAESLGCERLRATELFRDFPVAVLLGAARP